MELWYSTGRFPKEWNIRDAYIKDSRGKRVVDFKRSDIASTTVFAGLPNHVAGGVEALYLPYPCRNIPTWIPYRSSYYKET